MTMFYIKKILKHTAFYGISNLFVSLTSFLLIPILTRCLRPEEYGVYSLVAVFGTVVFYVYDMGMLHALVRYFAEVSHDKPEEGRRIASTVLWFLVIVSAVFSMILLSNSGRISYLMLGAKKYIFLIQLTVAVVFFNTVTGVSTTLLRIKERSNLFMWFFGLKGIGTIGLTFVFLVLLRRGLLGVFESMLLVAAVFLILLFVFTFREYRFSFSLSYLAQMIRFGLPLCPAMFFGWVIDFSDRYLVRYFLSLSDVGLYSLGYKISQIVFMIVMAFVMCWHPLIFNIIKEKNAQEILARLSTYVAVGFMFGCLVISMFGREIVTLIAESSYQGSYRVIPFISFSYYMFGIYMIFLSGVLISKQVLKQPVILGAASVINILLNIALIPRLGILGAAMATVLTYLFTVVYTYLTAQRSYRIPYNLRQLILMTAAGMALFAFSMLIPARPVINAVIIKFFILACFPVAIFMLGIFSKKQLLSGKEILVRTISKIT